MNLDDAKLESPSLQILLASVCFLISTAEKMANMYSKVRKLKLKYSNLKHINVSIIPSANFKIENALILLENIDDVETHLSFLSENVGLK